MLIFNDQKPISETLADIDKLIAELMRKNQELIEQGKRIQGR